MASSNIKLFDENKGNMLTDTEFNISSQRLNGLQTGVASSQLQNKAMYQASLVAYAIAQIMLQNGLNANDTDAVSAFVANLSSTILQKVYDIATTSEAQAGTATGKWMSPALVKAAFDYRKANTSEAQNATDDTKWMSPALVKAFFNYMKASTSEAQAGTNNTKWMSPALVKEAINALAVSKVYPVGSIYMSVNNTNPSTLFGGTWEQLKDRFLLAAGNTYSAGSTGGEATHTLTVNEMPSHNHPYYRYTNSGKDGPGGFYKVDYENNTGYTGSAGGGQPHNNMPPYLAVYVWKRTA